MARKKFRISWYKALFNFNLLIFVYAILIYYAIPRHFPKYLSGRSLSVWFYPTLRTFTLRWTCTETTNWQILQMCLPAPAPFVEIVKFDGSPHTPCVRPGPYAVTYPLLSESTWNLNGEPVQTVTIIMLYHLMFVGSILLCLYYYMIRGKYTV
jgi:hypothetical protein